MDEKQKLIDALKTIRKTCEKHVDACSSCPLGDDDGSCHILELSPCNWCINEPETIWRALS